VHQLADRREEGADGAILRGELFIQSRLELREVPGQLLVGDEELAPLSSVDLLSATTSLGDRQ
jgi:hypothetical protein